MLTPETAVEIQEQLGADMMMALDECTPYPPTRISEKIARADGAMGGAQYRGAQDTTQAIFGIVQGSVYRRLAQTERGADHLDSLRRLRRRRSFGRRAEAGDARDGGTIVSMLPPGKPRYLMGVGTPADLLAAIAMGFDMFDCVLPTRNARNGCAFTSRGRILIKHSATRGFGAAGPELRIAARAGAIHAPTCVIYIYRARFLRRAR